MSRGRWHIADHPARALNSQIEDRWCAAHSFAPGGAVEKRLVVSHSFVLPSRFGWNRTNMGELAGLGNDISTSAKAKVGLWQTQKMKS